MLIALCGIFASVNLGCSANEGILRSGKESPEPTVPGSGTDSFEKDLSAMRQVNFKWIYVIRRKDGGEVDRDDKAFIRTNADMANRRVLSDNGRAVIIGSNYFLGKDQLVALGERFDLTDLSPAESNSGEKANEQTSER